MNFHICKKFTTHLWLAPSILLLACKTGQIKWHSSPLAPVSPKRERETERQRDREREKDRQTERQRERGVYFVETASLDALIWFRFDCFLLFSKKIFQPKIWHLEVIFSESEKKHSESKWQFYQWKKASEESAPGHNNKKILLFYYYLLLYFDWHCCSNVCEGISMLFCIMIME